MKRGGEVGLPAAQSQVVNALATLRHTCELVALVGHL